MTRIATFNVENLFARPNAFDTSDWESGRPILDAYQEVNEIFLQQVYTPDDKIRIRQLLVDLDIYRLNDTGAARRIYTQRPQWAWLRKNRGKFDRQPTDRTQNVEIIADGRDAWIGWVELAVEPVDEIGTRMAARVIQDINADILGIVEAEDRPSLVRFNEGLIDNLYDHVMLVDGNDERGIDVGVMTKDNYNIESIRSNVDNTDDIGTIFSRDCPQYEITTPDGNTLHILINHFKSQSGGGDRKRQRQSAEVRTIVNRLVAQNEHVVVMGDLNEGPRAEGSQAVNLVALFNDDSPLVDCYSLDRFQLGERQGTYDSCGLRNRLDYILISRSLLPFFRGGAIHRRGLWGTRRTRPTAWETYPEMRNSSEQASDHAAVYIDLGI